MLFLVLLVCKIQEENTQTEGKGCQHSGNKLMPGEGESKSARVCIRGEGVRQLKFLGVGTLVLSIHSMNNQLIVGN